MFTNAFFAKFLNQIFNILFPPRCLCCNKIVATIGVFCSKCWQDIEFINNPNCYICSHPFEYDIGKNALCISCIKDKPTYSKAFVVFKYDNHSNKIIHKLKYSDCTYLAPYLANFMYRSLNYSKFDFIAPIPVHKRKLLTRMYNQSLLLAKCLSKLSSINLIPDLLLKVKNTKPQSSLNKKDRRKNVISAYVFNKEYKKLINGKTILLIDDVITTGATINYCSKLLLNANAKDVQISAIGKTIFK